MDNIQSVSIEYPKQRNQSFILEDTPDGYEVRPFYDITPRIRRPFRKGSAEAFLVNFESVGAEAFRLITTAGTPSHNWCRSALSP
ncbi:MAG: hypothetical protein H6560_27730 [Lewinellaceae bacterium]|nr:hypothetical protein [Lewinellaceae bacterium]